MLSRISRLVVAAALLLGSITATAVAPKHEMRGLWVATVYGIDWPSRVGSTAADAAAQKKELIALLDMARESGFNSIMLQVRPMGDAFYRSSFEPWSAYLTGARGQAPVTGWDPLKFAVEESHKRGLELHAWVNPFRFSASGLPDTSTDRKVISKGWILTNKKTVKTPTRKKVVKGRKGRKRTITVPGKKFRFGGIPTFEPEHFMSVSPKDTMKRKQFVKGVEQIAQEGAIQIFKIPDSGFEDVVVGVVGTLQFDVFEYRMKNEYGVDLRMSGLPYEHLRLIRECPCDVKDLMLCSGSRVLEDFKGRKLIAFGGEWSAGFLTKHNEGLILDDWLSV